MKIFRAIFCKQSEQKKMPTLPKVNLNIPMPKELLEPEPKPKPEIVPLELLHAIVVQNNTTFDFLYQYYINPTYSTDPDKPHTFKLFNGDSCKIRPQYYYENEYPSLKTSHVFYSLDYIITKPATEKEIAEHKAGFTPEEKS